MKKTLTALLLTVATLVIAPSPAQAGSYVLVGCADLAGALGPRHIVRPTDGWFLEQGVYPSRQDCAAGRTGYGMFATTGTKPNLFRLDAPAHTTIGRLVVTYRAHLSGAEAWAVPTFVVEAGHGRAWESIPPASGYIGGTPIDFGGDRVMSDAHAADALRIGVRCDLRGPCWIGGQPAARIHAVAVVLRDDSAPSAAITASGGHLRGTVELAVVATDEGGGVFERTLSVDGRRLAGGALCGTVPASVGPLRHVVRRVPCPLDAPVRVRLDTRTLVDGRHSLVARAEDVAGNSRTAEAGILVDNQPPRAGTVALVGEATVSEALTAEPTGFAGQDVAYAYRWQRCDAGGEQCAAIGGAVASTYALRPRDRGHRVRAVVSASDGGGSVRVASSPSAIVTVQATGPSGGPPGQGSGPSGGPPGQGSGPSGGPPAPGTGPSGGPPAPGTGPSGGPPAQGTGPSGGFSTGAPSATAGHLTAWLERGRRRLRATTVRWPTRVRIRGRLTDPTGRPLPHTVVRMLERIDGRRWRALTGVRTRRDGRFTTFTKIGPSRHLRLVYGRAAVKLRLRVRARARVTVDRAGALTLVSGRLLGGRVPPTGVRVRLQARRGARWSTRATLRTDGLGRFSATGRAPAGVRLRIAIPAQRGYPFARGLAYP